MYSLRSFALLRLLLIAAIMTSFTFLEQRRADAAGIDVPCDVNSLKLAMNSSYHSDHDIVINLTANCVYTLNDDVWELIIDPNSPSVTINVTINGNDAVIDGANQHQLFWIIGPVIVTMNNLTLRNGHTDLSSGGAIYLTAAGTVYLNNCTLSNNSAAYSGGAISIQTFTRSYSTAGSVFITDSVFSGNKALGYNGGAIYVNGGIVELTRSTLSDNTAVGNGGAIYSADNWNALPTKVSSRWGDFHNNRAGGVGGAIAKFGVDNTPDGTNTTNTLFIIFSTFSNNSANNGGAIFSGSDVPPNGITTVDFSTLSANTATPMTGSGGAIYNIGPLNIGSTTLDSNTAGMGGGIFNNDVLKLANDTLSGNGASVAGGGIYNNGGTITATYITVADNRATTNGAGIINDTGSVTLRNTLIARNPINGGTDVVGAFTSQGYNLIGNGTGSTGLVNGVNGDKVGTAAAPILPILFTLADNGGLTKTMALGVGSPALNAIPAASCFFGGDQRSIVRPQGINCDIGAFELEGGGVPREITAIPTDTLPAPTNTSLVPTNTATAILTLTQTPSPTIAVPTNTPQVPETAVPTPWGPPPRDDS